MRTSTRRGFAWLGPPLFFAAVVLALCWRVWLGGRAFSWDALWSYWGDFAVQIQAARRGELPLWNPFDRCGFPYFADPQNGTLYPLTWPLVALGLVVGIKWWLVAIKVMLHLWLWGLGMYVWLRRRGLPAAACAVAGIFCILEWPTSHGFFSALNWGMAWAPWVVLCLERWAERPDRARAALLALVTGMAWLVGAPASFWYILLVATPLGVHALVVAARAAADRRAFVRAAATSAVLAAGLFGAMVVGQIQAASALVPHTVRAARDLGFITDSLLISDSLFGIVVPRLPGLEMYFGMVNVFAALAAVTLRPSGRTYVLAAIAAGGFLLAVGSHGPWLPGVASLLPPAGLFRLPHRYVFVTLIAFAALAAEGLGALSAAPSPGRRAGRLFLVLGAAGVVIFGAGAVAVGPGRVRTAFLFAIGSWALSALVLRQLAVTGRRAWLLAAAALSVVDVYAARLPQIDGNNFDPWPAPVTAHDPDAMKMPGVPLAARIYDREYFRYRAGARLGIREFDGYEDDPLALRRYRHLVTLAYADAHLLGHANVAFLMGQKPGLAIPDDFKLLRPGVWALPATAPAVGWYGHADLVSGEEAALQALHEVVPGAGAILERETLTPDEQAALARPAAAAPVAGKMTDFGLNHLTAEVDAPAAGVVVVVESWHPGWRATVDGADAKVVPANGAFRGVLVGPGHHVIAMRYTSGATPLLMGLALLAMAAALILSLRRTLEK